jgi:hypothetical protein
MVGEWNCLE